MIMSYSSQFPKRGKKYFELLTSSEQEKFIENFSKRRGSVTIHEYMLQFHSNWHQFILCAFMWNTTPEGYIYWNEVACRLEQHTK